MSVSYASGPFVFEPAGRPAIVAGVESRTYSLSYNGQELVSRRVPVASASLALLRETFADEIAAFFLRARTEHAPMRHYLVSFETGERVGFIDSDSMCAMTPGLIDDRSEFWLQSADRLYSRPVSLSEFGEIARAEGAPSHSWIAGLLPDEVLTADADAWRAPTAWEIRHVIGEGSATRISGAAAAGLLGVTPQNFRKYTAADDAATRQKMSYAMWHLLLARVGVQLCREAGARG